MGDEFQRRVGEPRTTRQVEADRATQRDRPKMTGDDVRQIREAIGRLLGRKVSQQDLGLALGLAPANAATTVRRWEESEPTGPAAVALAFMREATDLSKADYGGGFEWTVRVLFGE